MLQLMVSTLANMLLSLALPIKSVAEAPGCLPGSLRLLSLHDDLFGQARLVMQAHPDRRRLNHAAQAYWHAPGNPRALDCFEHQVRQEFVAGRVIVLDGWVVAETELALLALIRGSL
jgi:hypothetical protein